MLAEETAAAPQRDLGVDDQIAHLLRRLTFGPFPGQVETLARAGYAEALARVLYPEDDGLFWAPLNDVPVPEDSDSWAELQIWWIDQMRNPNSGLHEKMVWFWHNHFTSSGDKCSAVTLAGQHRTVRQYALGNFRDFAKAMVSDPAMMLYLDASGSEGRDPNENLAREMMELFTLGRGAYTESDVKAAARSLAGWWIDWQTGEANYEPDMAYPGVVEFLGERGRFAPADLVDIICDQPACAPFIAGKLHDYLAGFPASPERLAELADTFRNADLELFALVEAIVDHPSFLDGYHARPRIGIEWFVATAAILDAPATSEEHLWQLEGLDQEPFYPPNVAGWDLGPRWVSPSQMLARSNLVLDMMSDDDNPVTFSFDGNNPVPDALRRCSLPSVSDTTAQALDEAYWAPFSADDVNSLLIFLLVTSPDFSMA